MLWILQIGFAYAIMNAVLKANSGTKSKGKSPVGGATGDFFVLIFKSLLTGCYGFHLLSSHVVMM